MLEKVPSVHDMLTSCEDELNMQSVLVLLNERTNMYNMLSKLAQGDEQSINVQTCTRDANRFCDDLINSTCDFREVQHVNESPYTHDDLCTSYLHATYVAGVPLIYAGTRVGALCVLCHLDVAAPMAGSSRDTLERLALQFEAESAPPDGEMVLPHRQKARRFI